MKQKTNKEKRKEKTRREIKIPEGIAVAVNINEDDNHVKDISIKNGEKEIKKEFHLPNIDIAVKDGKEKGKIVEISSKKGTKRESKIAGTAWAILKNMIQGLQEEFVYKLEICNVHFPMNVQVDETSKSIIVKSFLGETTERKAKILDNVKVEIKGSEITVSSPNRENAGQTAANIEKITRLSGRDRRIFQDGIFITHKPGREI